jgi:hypothetical protein
MSTDDVTFTLPQAELASGLLGLQQENWDVATNLQNGIWIFSRLARAFF